MANCSFRRETIIPNHSYLYYLIFSGLLETKYTVAYCSIDTVSHSSNSKTTIFSNFETTNYIKKLSLKRNLAAGIGLNNYKNGKLPSKIAICVVCYCAS